MPREHDRLALAWEDVLALAKFRLWRTKKWASALALQGEAKGVRACEAIPALVGDRPYVLTGLASASGAVLVGCAGAGTGAAVGGAVGAAGGAIPACLTLGLSVPYGLAVGCASGAATGGSVAGVAGLLGGGTAGYMLHSVRGELAGYVVRVIDELREGLDLFVVQPHIPLLDDKMYKAPSWLAESSASSSDSDELEQLTAVAAAGIANGIIEVGRKARRAVAAPRFRTAAALATGSAAVGGVGGGAFGLATGGALGGIAGLIPAVFTFGLSVPVGIMIGSGAGMCAGSVVGGAAGLVGGASAGMCLGSAGKQAVKLQTKEV